MGVSREDEDSRPAMTGEDEQSFMQESSLHNLFPTGNNNISSGKNLVDERTYDRLSKVASSIRSTLP